ncbi:MAG: outer membrane lipoprotein-sorting protein [Spirochaetia bacterium]|nr:outer membrane lipoprotein-sorting protein [Spirochaetia bacterium]
MKTKFFILTTLLTGSFSFPAYPEETVNQTDNGKAILEEFRKILSVNNKEYRAIFQLATFVPNQKPIVKTFTVYSKSNKTLLIFSYPERDLGKKILMINDQLWQYFPKIQKTLVINSSMNLSGSVNLTDIVSSSLFNLYNFIKVEHDRNTQNYILSFQAINKNAPYGLVKYYYVKGKILYFEAYARSGILLKKIYFVKYEADDHNQIYPVQIKIVNALLENDYSLIKMSSVQAIDIPDYYFNPSALENAGE